MSVQKVYTCIVCPNGCEITATIDGRALLGVGGARCPRGADYVRGEVTAPVRTIATSVAVAGGVLPLTSVRLTKPIPRERIPEAMAAIRALRLTAPVQAGTVVLPSILGLDSDVLVTKNVAAREP